MSFLINPYTSSGPFGGTAAVLLHFDGSNGATTTTDVYGHTVTLSRTPSGTDAGQLRTEYAKFGTTGIGFSWNYPYTNYGYAYIANTADLRVGSGDWTIDFWTKASNNYSNHTYHVSKQTTPYGSHGISIYQDYSSNLYLYAKVGDGSTSQTLGASYTPGSWHWVVLQRSGNVFTLWIDGTLKSTVTSALGSLDDNGALNLGAGPAAYVQGGMDEFRFVVGAAKFSGSTISVPTAPY